MRGSHDHTERRPFSPLDLCNVGLEEVRVSRNRRAAETSTVKILDTTNSLNRRETHERKLQSEAVQSK